jgi:tRNA dimethylallyltransferase
MPMSRPLLFVVTGPTGSGKTALSIAIARQLGCEIISADSRQLYREIPITTAAPTADELAAVPHHFVGTLSLTDYYSAAQFETDVLKLLPCLFSHTPYAVMCGGSMMYVDAVVNGIDEMPTISEATRQRVLDLYQQHGLEGLNALLQISDPDYFEQVDRQNPKRVIHALEITIEAGKPYSTLRTGQRRQRDFDVLKLAIDLPRDEMFDRINRRVDKMLQAGMIDEARRVYPLRHLNSLNTVGFKELFAYFDGTMDLPTATARIAKNTRVYAKKQLTWLKRDDSVRWLSHEDVERLNRGDLSFLIGQCRDDAQSCR